LSLLSREEAAAQEIIAYHHIAECDARCANLADPDGEKEMSHFPESVSKTQWQRMGAGARMAAAQALLAGLEFQRGGDMSRSGTIALLRGLPERPVWKKTEPTSKDCELLIKRAKRKLSREHKEMVYRSRVQQNALLPAYVEQDLADVTKRVTELMEAFG
jgi:hypothetical protein